MSQEEIVLDPREKISHPIEEGQVYRDARYEEDSDRDIRLRLVFVDDNRVLMKGPDEYRFETRRGFEDNVGSNRYQLTDNTEGVPELPGAFEEMLSVVKRMRDNYARQDGRKSAHMAEGIQEVIEELESFSAEEIDWNEIDGVGKKTASALRDAGFRTDADIRAASHEQLLDVSGIGEKNLQRIYDRCGINR